VRLRLKNVLLVEDLTWTREQITRLNRELEERVDTRTRQLRQALADRDRFVSIVSHELRTPLTSMRLTEEILARLFRSKQIDAGQLARLLPVLSRQTDRMRGLVDDLLDVGRLSADQMRYRKEPVELARIVGATMEQMAPQLAVASASFSVDLDEGLVGIWDPDRLQQVFVNLMTNALKYGARPFSITAHRRGDRVRIAVRDSGRGIPREYLQRIFEAFQRLESAPGPAGLGLGLYIAERIVRAHGGTIHAESAPGRGSTFIIELPLAPSNVAHPPHRVAPRGNSQGQR
jgi:signal transduction histidine kinase